MSKNETLKEAWENLPNYKKNWIKIVAVAVAIGLILGTISIIQTCKQQAEVDKAFQEAQKLVEQHQKLMRSM